jgi:TrmH family RNA methyltransferase
MVMNKRFVSPRLFLYISNVNVSQSEIKYLRLLQQKKYRDGEGKFLLEGWRPLQDALESDFTVEMVAVVPQESEHPAYQSILARIQKLHIPLKELKELQLKQISDTIHSQGVVALVHQRHHTFDGTDLRPSRYILAGDHISDPGNLGTILRTCDWFGIDTVLLSEGCVSCYNEKVVRATAGSIFHVNVFENLDLIQVLTTLQTKKYRLVATALEGTPLHTHVFSEKDILILGSEAHGVSQKLLQLADEVISIPQFGKAESLNVGIACGICLDRWRNQNIPT